MTTVSEVNLKLVPKGRARNEAAICHWAGPFAVQSIKEGVSLKHTVVERDGSHPVLTAEKGFESDTHAREPVFADRKFAHINLPREGESLEEKFRVQYINGTACDADFQIVLRTIDGSETVVVEQATLDGNRYDQHLSRPAVPAGQYTLVVKLLTADVYEDNATVSVAI